MELDTQELEFSGAINREMGKFNELKEQAVNLDQDELTAARLALRQQMENEGRDVFARAHPMGGSASQNIRPASGTRTGC